ncbi:hypothetical protein SOVF_032880 [Spinacia oleracea]|nr:hypothetical protein SOVF_032880 [Spinacia oleracea]
MTKQTAVGRVVAAGVAQCKTGWERETWLLTKKCRGCGKSPR